MDDGTRQVSDEHVAHDWGVDHVVGDPVVFDAGLCTGSGDESGVVGVVVVDVYEGVDAAVDEVCEQELHVSGFVASESETGGIVAFDEEGRDGFEVGAHEVGDGGTEAGHFLEGRVFAR